MNIPSKAPRAIITLFPEDPGNANPANLTRDGDGVIGYNEGNGIRSGGAAAFIERAVADGNIKNIAIFGYSHGGGATSVLTEVLWHYANN